MKAYDIATKFNLGEEKTQKSIENFIRFVKETDDPDIKGLTNIMVEELRNHWLNGILYKEKNIDTNTRFADAQFLLARLLLDKSSYDEDPSQTYIKAQLQNLAWDCGSHNDHIKDWIDAERKYIREGLDYLVKLRSKKSERV